MLLGESPVTLEEHNDSFMVVRGDMPPRHDEEARQKIDNAAVRRFAEVFHGEKSERDRAFAEVQRLFEPYVRALITKKAFGTDQGNIDDITQEVFVGLMRTFPTFDATHPETFRSWLSTVVRFQVIEASRRQRGKKGTHRYSVDTMSLADMTNDGTPFDIRGTDASPEEQIINADRARSLRIALRTLPDRERRLVIMRGVLGIKLKDIGEIFGFTESRAAQLYKAAKEQMENALKQDAGRKGLSQEEFDALVEEVRVNAENILGTDSLAAAAK